MTSERPLLSLPQIAKKLRVLLNKKVTGVFFLATEDNRSAYLVLEAGEFRNIVFQNTKGAGALEKLHTIPRARCRFARQKSVSFVEADPALRDANLVLSILAKSSNNQTPPKEPAPAHLTVKKNEASGAGLDLQPILDIVIEEAIEYLGPMAESICEEHFEEISPSTLEQLLEALDAIGKEFNDDKQASEFILKVTRRLESELSI